MKPNIFIIGSTGTLGSRLLRYCHKSNIKVFGISCFKNKKKLISQSKKYKINNLFCLSLIEESINFDYFLSSNNIDIIYFLDTSAYSIKHLYQFNKFQRNSLICIANKELVISCGPLLNKLSTKSNNEIIPLDSEHFSLLNSTFSNSSINKVYITASGGPFYFKKSINLDKVSLKSVLSHPKWKMGINNSIDSSNFINKILEIFELSHLFNLPLNKIDFLISKEAYVHSLIEFKDSTVQINCFHNDMIIPMIKPLSYFYDLNLSLKKSNIKYLDYKNLFIEKKNDKRFFLFNYLKKIRSFNHNQQILFLLLNKKAHNLYLSGKIPYENIIKFILKNMKLHYYYKKLNTFKDVINYIYSFEKKF